MKVADVYDEMATRDSHLAHLQEADNEDYQVIAEDGGFLYDVKGVRWDHHDKRMVLEIAPRIEA